MPALPSYRAPADRWQLPSNYFSVDLPTVSGGPTIRAVFVDENPFIIAYNSTNNKYKSPYYIAHVGCPLLSLNALWQNALMHAHTGRLRGLDGSAEHFAQSMFTVMCTVEIR